MLHDEGLDDYVCRVLHLAEHEPDLDRLAHASSRGSRPPPSRCASGSSASTSTCPTPTSRWPRRSSTAASTCGAQVEIDWIASDDAEGLLAEGRLGDLDGIVIPGGFGFRGIEGKIAAAGFAREQEVPFLGLCLGMQCAVIEFARDVCGLAGANSSEFDPHTPAPGDRPHGRAARRRRQGRHDAPRRLPGEARCPARSCTKAYGEEVVYERHRHRYEVNNKYRAELEEAGLVCSGTSPDDRLVEFVELPDHPFFVGTQAHPEFKSRPDRPHPLFAAFVRAALERAEGRVPRLPIIDATEALEVGDRTAAV